ncbi:MAG: carbon-nitrogen hydrolase family protein [Dehalococcoidales bacterium]|nr:carbon-nitrogen hydrolase family protein [Dehalococcoidales bacterium]NLT28423.1 carbon-nitrogen hydrolase family protein [Dehalococcoidales bacterium]
MIDTVKIAAVQMEPKLMQNKYNLDNIISKIITASERGAQLIVFPECSLSGYLFTSLDEALPYMETVPGPSTDEITKYAKQLNVYIIFGLLEKEGNKHFNTAALIGPDGLIGKYRKIHLPFLGIDRFIDKGDKEFKVYNTPIGNIGIHICYDCNFPECARVMALLGADILALPTNWPAGRQKIAEHVVLCRAYENKVNFVAANRTGIERDVKFIGLSRIVDTSGEIIAGTTDDSEQIVYANISLKEARQKHITFKAREFEINFFADRRPEFYDEITDKRK